LGDKEGLDLPGQRAAEVQAALSLTDAARQLEAFASSDGLAVDVRDASGPVLRAIFVRETAQPIN
jgi:hypothetical protein